MPTPLTVGFDLDMTLLDTRPGIRRVWQELAALTGIRVDADLAVSRLGPPLDVEMAQWVPAEQVPEFVAKFRGLYPDHAINPALVLPGAAEALAAVRRHGGRTMVVTAKHEPLARRHLEHLGLDVDVVAGGLFAEGKAAALRREGARIYVGDTGHDVLGARAAAAVSVAVASGPCSAPELRAAGADVVLADLHEFGPWLDEHVLEGRLHSLETQLRRLGSVAVAFSGGADSAFLLAAAVRALGASRVVALTAVSPALPQTELEGCRGFAASLGVRHLTPETAELERDGYRANDGDRCYFCKAELLDVLTPLAAGLDLAVVATGTNADDAVAGFRPGIRAAAERGAVTPLRDAGLTKAQIREASRRWGLTTWDKPAAACLSSRIAYGVEVSASRLSRVARAELALRTALADAGVAVRNLRVRDLGDAARIELDADVVAVLQADPGLTDRCLAEVTACGFSSVEVDRRGFRSGSMNELLAQPDAYR